MKITMENNILKNFITNQPVWFAIAISVFDLLLGLVVFMVGGLIGLPEELLELVVLLAITALPPVLIGWMGWWRDAGFVSTIQNAGALAILPFTCMAKTLPPMLSPVEPNIFFRLMASSLKSFAVNRLEQFATNHGLPPRAVADFRGCFPGSQNDRNYAPGCH